MVWTAGVALEVAGVAFQDGKIRATISSRVVRYVCGVFAVARTRCRKQKKQKQLVCRLAFGPTGRDVVRGGLRIYLVAGVWRLHCAATQGAARRTYMSQRCFGPHPLCKHRRRAFYVTPQRACPSRGTAARPNTTIYSTAFQAVNRKWSAFPHAVPKQIKSGLLIHPAVLMIT